MLPHVSLSFHLLALIDQPPPGLVPCVCGGVAHVEREGGTQSLAQDLTCHIVREVACSVGDI